MSKKKPFVLRLKPEMMEALEKWATDEFRSVNGQIEWLLHRTLKEANRYKPPRGSVTDNPNAKNPKDGTPD